MAQSNHGTSSFAIILAKYYRFVTVVVEPWHKLCPVGGVQQPYAYWNSSSSPLLEAKVTAAKQISMHTVHASRKTAASRTRGKMF